MTHERQQRRLSRQRVATIAGLLAVAGAIAVAVTSGASAPNSPAAGSTTISEASTVERRDLVQTDTEAGTLSYADPRTVYNRLSGTITWLPSVGQEIRPGGTLFRVDGRPVILMDGTSPAYRELAPGVGTGQDVGQLNRNLLNLGFEPQAIVPDDEWQAATTAGVEELQTSLGERATGKLGLGQVVFLPGDRLVSAVEATLGDGGGGGGGEAGSRGAGEGGGSQSPGPSGVSPSDPGAGSARGSAGPQADNHHPSDSSGTNGEGEGTSPTAILQTTSTRLVVTVDLDASKQSEARRGEHVEVGLPNGETVGGRIADVSAVALGSSNDSAADEGGGEAGGGGTGGVTASIPVTITLTGRYDATGLDQAAASVSFAEAVARRVLSVPVTALLATGGADYAVQEAAPPHRLLPVTTGLFAAGYVQISGPGVHPGLRVSDAQG